MTITRTPLLRSLAAVGAAFALALAVFAVLARHESPVPHATAIPELPVLRPGATTDERIAAAQAAVRAYPRRAEALATLGSLYLQKVRETGDPGFYQRAQRVLRRALELAPHSADALDGAATLALARHDFRAGLRLGRAALAAAPARVLAYPAIVDAEVELGRYRSAARDLQRFIDLKPTLAGYARASYLRELHGDLHGAVDALDLALDAGTDVPENLAYVATLRGNLELQLGQRAGARHDYELALARFRGYPAALAGLARVDAEAGQLDRAIRRYRAVVARLPLPQYVVALGDAELAAGRPAAAHRDLALVGAEERLLRAAGVNTDVDLALFEADHGSPARGVALARRAWVAAPSVRSADALGWALARAGQPQAALHWARRALSLGSRDPSFLYHAGMAARAAGDRADARRWLAEATAREPRFSPLYGPRAQRALEALR